MERAQNSLLKIYDFGTGEVTLVARFPYVIEAPNWMQDGKDLIYNANGHIYRYHLENGEIEEVYTGVADACNNDHVLNPDGSGIAVSSGMGDDWKSRIFRVDFQTREVREIVSVPFSYLHGWSPDGGTLAFCGAREQENGELEFDIYTVPVEGGAETRLTTTPGLNDGPEYAPDGKKIWFNSVRTGLMQVWNMNPDGSDQRQMTFDEEANAWFPHVSPDGKTVVYIIYHKGDLLPGEHVPDKNVEIRTIPAEGGEEKTLISFFGGQGSINVNSWAPDSRRFAFVSYER